MVALIMPFLTTIWNKISKYVMIAGAVIASVWFIYVRGARDQRLKNERDVLRQDLENRDEAKKIRHDVGGESDAASKLREQWSRNGR